MKVSAALALTLAISVAAVGPAAAHHSFAMYDSSRTVTLKGAVKTFQWTNPHVTIWVLAAPSTGGEPALWSVELTSPGNLTRLGWSRKSLKAGDVVEIQISPLRDGQRGGSFKTARISATGQVLTANWVQQSRTGQTPEAAMLTTFADWLRGSALTAFMENHAWAVPAVQTVHILAIAIVVGGAAITNLRVLGIVDRGQPVSAVLDRFLPSIAGALVVLAATGLLLIASEPTRALFRTLFWVKMGLVFFAAAATWSQKLVLSAPRAWDGVGAPPLPYRLLAGSILLLWIGVIFAGRWIGYVSSWPDAPFQ